MFTYVHVISYMFLDLRISLYIFIYMFRYVRIFSYMFLYLCRCAYVFLDLFYIRIHVLICSDIFTDARIFLILSCAVPFDLHLRALGTPPALPMQVAFHLRGR